MALSPPSRLRTLSISSVSSTTSDTFNMHMRSLSMRSDSSSSSSSSSDGSDADTPRAPQAPGGLPRTRRRKRHYGAPLVDRALEPGCGETGGAAEVALAVESFSQDKDCDDLLWILTWDVGSGRAARVVRRGGQLFQVSGGRDGRGPEDVRVVVPDCDAVITTMRSDEYVAGTRDLKLPHMAHYSLGKLTYEQRRGLTEVAARTACRTLVNAGTGRVSRIAQTLSHRQWVEAVLQESAEYGFVDAEKARQAIGSALNSL